MNSTIQSKILAIKSNSKPVSSYSLFYKEKKRVFDVFEVDPNLLRFNHLNGRIGTEMLEHWGDDIEKIENYEVEELNNLIENFIWQKTTKANNATKRDIEDKGQLIPGIITRDGIIVDGNRRFMCVRKLNREGKNYPFLCVILDDTYDDGADHEKQIKILETQIQIGADEKLAYGSLEKYWNVIHFKEKYIDITNPTMHPSQLVKLMKLSNEKEIVKIYGIGKLMQEYLVYIECPNIYSRLKDTEELFIRLYSNYNLYKNGKGKVGWDIDEFNLEEYKYIGFDLIRWIYNSDKSNTGDWDSKKIRAIYFTDSDKKSVIPNKKLWEELKSFHRDKISINENHIVAEEFYEETKNYSLAAEKADKIWASKVSNEFKNILGVTSRRLEDKTKINMPGELLKESLDKLINLVNEDKFVSEGIVEIDEEVIRGLQIHGSINFDIANKIRKISEELKKQLKV